jgi:hypothetical protein
MLREFRKQLEEFHYKEGLTRSKVKQLLTLIHLHKFLTLLSVRYNKVRDAAVMKEVRNFSAWKISYRFKVMF